MLRITLILLCCGFFTTTLLAQPQTDVDKAEVMAWIQQLENRQAARRNDAEKKLTQADPSVLEYLPAITDRTNAELKERLLRIRDVLRKEQAAELTKASRVTLQGEMTLGKALETIATQTKNQVIDFRERLNQPADDTMLTLDIDDVPFWEAFDQLADEANVTIYPFVGEARKLAIVAAGETAQPRAGTADYVGLFRIEPTTLGCQRNLRDASGDILRLTVELIWEPRVLPILVRQNFDDVQVVADNGDSVDVQQSGNRQIPIQPGVASLDIQIPVTLPPREVKELKTLSGKFIALVPGGDVTFEFDDLVNAKGAEQSKSGLTVVLDDIRLSQGFQQVSLRVRFDDVAGSLQSHLDWVENNIVRLVDSNGKPADEPGYYERYFERDSEIGFRYVFPVEKKDLAGWKLVYTSPAGVSEVEVPFEIKDIPLP